MQPISAKRGGGLEELSPSTFLQLSQKSTNIHQYYYKKCIISVAQPRYVKKEEVKI